MGTDPAKDDVVFDSEYPQHVVTLDAFQIGMFPVTVAEYACFVRSTRRSVPPGFDNDISGVSWKTQLRERLDHPVVQVSWYDAAAYAQWLSEQTGQAWRLPTEAEWEKAA